MAMPIDLVLVRHGESEGNLAMRGSYQEGDESAFTDEFKERHSWQWRLTDEGRKQAKAAGRWIRGNLKMRFHGFFTSEYVRAMETAAHLGIPHAEWKCELYLRERDGGVMEKAPASKRTGAFAEANEARRREPLLWIPENGLSVADVCLRVDRVIDTLHREYAGKNVIIVCHGEVMWAFRARLERYSIDQFNERKNSRDPRDEIHNCQILHYTRTVVGSGGFAPYYVRTRSVCPWDMSRSSNEWQDIVRKKYSNSELLKRVGRFPQVVA